MSIDIADDASHEDIESAVEQLIEQRSQAPDDTSDAQAIAEGGDQATTQPEDSADDGDDSAADGGDAGSSESQAEWLDDEVKADAAAYGIDEKQLAQFQSREELDRTLNILDARSRAADQQAQDEGASEEDDEEGQSSGADPDGPYTVGLSEEYDDGIRGEFKRLADYMEAQLSRLNSQVTDSDAIGRQQQFDKAIDAMKAADIFGTTGKESKAEIERRQEVFTEVEAVMEGRKAQGREIGSFNSLVNRIARGVYADLFDKKTIKKRTRQLSSQANSRQGGGTPSPNDAPETPKQAAIRMYAEYERRGAASS